jgi:sugar-specific transcriptional regulator TrmB
MEKLYLKVQEVAELLGISEPKAYQIMRQLNKDLSEKGFITISGRVSRQYFIEKFYGMGG